MQQVQPYFTISSAVLLKQYKTDSLPGKPLLNVLLDLPADHLPALLALLGNMQCSFIVSLPASSLIEPLALHELLPVCYLLCSMHNYVYMDGIIIPVFQRHTTQHNTTVIEKIKSFFYSQGADIQIPIFEYYDYESRQVSKDCSFSVYTYGIHKVPDMTERRNIIAFTPAITELPVFTRLLAQVIVPDSGADIFKAEDYTILEDEVKNWKKRSALYRQFLQLSKTVQEQEYYEVLDWYKKEYEILPLWYKRFGHIIKVIMGKRSFRSLFNDNVKKYKD